MPIAGARRFRQWAFSAAQSAHGTAGTPSVAFPWSGTPEINPNWTDQEDIDVGSIDQTLTPYRMQTDTTVTMEGNADYDSLNVPLNAGIRGGVTPTGAGPYTWTNTALSLTATTLDEFTAQWGDDYGKDDVRFIDGIVEQITITFPEDLGPARISTNWYFGTANQHVTKVPSLVVGSNLPLIFAADTALYINSTAGTIGTTQITDALHSGQITITNTIDRKRFMNGSNSRFGVNAYALAEREIEVELTFAKVDAIAGFSSSELRNLFAVSPVTRYVQLKSISPLIAGGSTPFSWTQDIPLTWRSRGDGEIGGNTTVTLTGMGRYDSALGYAYKSIVVNSNSALP